MFALLTHSKHRNFQRIWIAQLISQFGDRIHQLALIGFIAERQEGSAMGLAKLLAFTVIPVFIIQPFAGVFVDRWDRKKTLFICDLMRGFLVLLIPFLFMNQNSMIPIYGVVFFVFCFSRFYFPAKMSVLPDIIDEENLFKANSLISTTGMIAFVAGCALGGFLIDRFGSRNGFIIDSGTFFLLGFIVFSVSLPIRINKEKIVETGKEIIGPIRKSVWKEIKEGFVYSFEHKEIRLIIDMLFVVLSAAGAIYVVMIVFIQQAFNSVTKDLGILAVSLGAGLFAGAIIYGKLGKKFLWYKTIFMCLTGGGAILVCFALLVANYPNIVWVLILTFFWGVVIGPIFIAANTVAHLVSDESMRGKVFSVFEIVIHFAFLLAMFLSSWISQFIAYEWILISVGILIIGVGIIGLLNIKRGIAISKC